DDTGYRHLCRLATLAASAAVGGRGTDGGGRAGGPGYPAAGVDREALWRWGDGLIVLSGCARGEVPSLLAAGRRDGARAVARAYREGSGPDCFLIRAASAAVGGRGTDGGGRAGGPGYPAAGVDREALWRWGDGLIVLSGCARGEIPSLLAAGRRDEARAVARAYRERFGPDGFFI